jgi:crossover junction endodeoxyribonuclease RuvC
LRVLGIDPGLHVVGYGLVSVSGGDYRAEDYGVLRTSPKSPFSQRLKIIYEYVCELVDRLRPDTVAIEEVYVSQNAKTSLRLGHTRGVIILAAVQKGYQVAEYAPREIKQAVVGQGAASKEQIRGMMARILNIPMEKLCADSADGLAAALCHGLRNA